MFMILLFLLLSCSKFAFVEKYKPRKNALCTNLSKMFGENRRNFSNLLRSQEKIVAKNSEPHLFLCLNNLIKEMNIDEASLLFNKLEFCDEKVDRYLFNGLSRTFSYSYQNISIIGLFANSTFENKNENIFYMFFDKFHESIPDADKVELLVKISSEKRWDIIKRIIDRLTTCYVSEFKSNVLYDFIINEQYELFNKLWTGLYLINKK